MCGGERGDNARSHFVQRTPACNGVKGALPQFGLVELRRQGRITMVGQRSLELAVIDAAEGQRR